MPADVLPGKPSSYYKFDGYMPLTVVIGEEHDYVQFIDWCRDDTDILELQINPSNGSVCQVSLVICASYECVDGDCRISASEDGLLVPNMSGRVDSDGLFAYVYSDAIVVSVSSHLVVRRVRSGNVLFGMDAAGEIAEVAVVGLSESEVGHTRELLS